MDDINNINNLNEEAPRPRFKKVKRIVRKPEAMPNFNDPVYNIEDMESSDLSDLDLDRYLDDEDIQPEPSYQHEQKQLQQASNVPNIIENTQVRQPLDIEKTPQFLDDNDIDYEDNYSYGISKKLVALFVVVAFLLGIVCAKVFFKPSQVVRNGLQGVIPNQEVPRGRARCGLTDKTQGCVLYVMNPQRQDLSGREFYDIAAQLTGRQRFVIETGNMRYSNVKIRPGEIAQLNIPPL